MSVVNLRVGYALVFGDQAAQEAYEAECERARAVQRTRYAVAPRQSVTLHDGRVLSVGQEVRLSHFRSDERPAWAQLERLIRTGVVLEADIPGDEQESA